MPIPALPVNRWGCKADADDGRLRWGGHFEPRPLPPEWTLRALTDANLDDDDTVVGLLNEHGPCALPYFDPSSVPPHRHARLGYNLPKRDDDPPDRPLVSVEDARWWLQTCRALAHVWAASSIGTDPAQVWTAHGFPAAGCDERHCWMHFSGCLSEGLRQCPPRVEYHVIYDEGFEVTFGRPEGGLYSAACLEIFNFIVQGKRARRCENEKCGRIFVHQLGGAKYDQHRNRGLLRFCTIQCSNAHRQRQHRRRKAANNKEPKR